MPETAVEGQTEKGGLQLNLLVTLDQNYFPQLEVLLTCVSRIPSALVLLYA